MLHRLLAKSRSLRTSTKVHRHRRLSVLLNLKSAHRNSTTSGNFYRNHNQLYQHIINSTVLDLPFVQISRMASFSTLSTNMPPDQVADIAKEFKSLWLIGRSPEPLLQLMMKLNATSNARK